MQIATTIFILILFPKNSKHLLLVFIRETDFKQKIVGFISEYVGTNSGCVGFISAWCWYIFGLCWCKFGKCWFKFGILKTIGCNSNSYTLL